MHVSSKYPAHTSKYPNSSKLRIEGTNSIRYTCLEHDPNNTISIEKPITGDNVQRNKIKEKRFDSLPGEKSRRRLHQVVFLGILTVRVAVHP